MKKDNNWEITRILIMLLIGVSLAVSSGIAILILSTLVLALYS